MAAYGLLAAATALYTAANLYRLAHFYPLDFDLAIFTQGVWRLSRGEAPLVSIHGLNLFGEHASWVNLFIAPLAALLGPWGDARLLVVVQSAALAAAGGLLYRIARRELGALAAFVVLLAYLAYPALQHTWLEYYEPINLAIPCLLAATQAVRESRDRRAALFSLLALLTIENVAVTVVALGLYAIVRGRRRLGAILVAGSLVYLALLMWVVFPWLSPRGYGFADRLYGAFASSLPDAILYLARPDHLLARLATPANGLYVLGLLVPVAFLPLAAPAILALAVQLPLNLIASWPYAHEIRYHYVAPIVPFVFLAVIAALARIPVGPRRVALLALLAGVVVGQALYGSPWIFPREGSRWWRGTAADALERSEMGALLARVPSQASVSAHYPFLPALAQRPRLYMFPDLGPAGTWPDALVIQEMRLIGALRDESVLSHARDLGGYVEIARTSTGTVLLMREAASGGEERAPVPLSPPVGRPGTPLP